MEGLACGWYVTDSMNVTVFGMEKMMSYKTVDDDPCDGDGRVFPDPGQIEITQRRIVIREAAVLLELLSHNIHISKSLSDRLETMAKRLRAVES